MPLASRLAQVAEFVEEANRVGGPDAARALVRERRGKQFPPALADLVDAEADVILSGLDSVATAAGHRVPRRIEGPAASRPARSRSCGCWRADSPTRRPPRASPARGGREARARSAGLQRLHVSSP